MPVILGRDKDGCFARFGKKGAKYHYECGNETQRLNARKKAIAQGVAIGEFVEKNSIDENNIVSQGVK